MSDKAQDLNQRIAARLRELRGARGLSLEALARRSGVSRSMISLIERGESSPTAILLERIASGLDLTLAALFDIPAIARKEAAGPVSRRDDQPVWRDPGSGYRRRNISPPGIAQPLQIVDVRFPAGARVAFENSGRARQVHQQVWVLAGAITVTVGKERYRLRQGDCLAMQLDQPTLFHNATRKPARYAVVTASEGVGRR